ncbi:hydantoinase/oxoprolinase family protein [Peribacillus cavernae]|uniref:Hydantoinase/oxoprolinase family protein n=1 Tax=Peribacillus cavernae TaxID=1674310 RepID=A0A3S0TXQ1_9BACI|nr:hydantoinase/oxoprolinase family protein [Peribacillus cavernae]MDQ0219526.1 5-oxoprolinase (ATP-hydrolyzing)/N-methylhydantoinase A [Peribacillus cavernae]RUQ27062.1 hydantoinase/oxoprolinase family protein [Peribacillus cavernae]
MIRLGVDVGGTFTDLVLTLEESDQSWVHKVPSTPLDPSEAVINGVTEICEMAGIEPSEIEQFFHGTTVATNIVLEHNGADVGMITTEGFRDILHIARHKRPYNFSLYQDLPWQKYPLVRRRNRLVVPERILATGEILTPLDEEETRRQVRKLKEAKVSSIAVCFLYSFKNPKHEDRVKEIIQEEYPEAYLSISNEVLPQYREYERFSTVALNAYIGPKTSRYIQRLEEVLKKMGLKTSINLMQSNGGIATAQVAAEKPISLLLSGPVAGLIGGIKAAKKANFDNIITLDIGGTSADIGVAPNGNMRMRHLLDTRIGQYNAMVPMVDIDTIGAGGGSIAYVDEGGIFRVGPQSAGADPGPACYDRGGTVPTSTDANVLLGRIHPQSRLAGSMQIKPELSKKAFDEHIASKLQITPLEAAAGALKIMTHNMVNAIEMNSVRKGYDPRGFTLVAAGGAGPLFACDIAEELNIPYVVVPPYPGITAAMGLLSTDIAYEKVHTLWGSLTNPDIASIQNVIKKLEKESLKTLTDDGLSEAQIVLKRVCDCRYAGQGYELRVDAPEGEINEEWIREVIKRFHQTHEREYASQFPDQEVVAINVRVIGIGLVQPEKEQSFLDQGKDDFNVNNYPSYPVYFWVQDKLEKQDSTFINREDIPIGTKLLGPAVIQQKDSTTLIPPSCTATFDEYGNIVIDMKKKLSTKRSKEVLASLTK